MPEGKEPEAGDSSAPAKEEEGVLLFPKASVKRIMKLDPDTKHISGVSAAALP